MPTSGISSRRWLSQLEAAEYLGVTDRTVRNYLARGNLAGRRIRGSRLIRIDRAELDAMLRPIPTIAGGGDPPGATSATRIRRNPSAESQTGLLAKGGGQHA